MKLEHGRKLAIELMTKHGVYPLFHFKFSKAKNTLGCCDYEDPNNLILWLSTEFVENSSKAKVREVILHETAHCLDVFIRGRSAHDAFWRSIATEIGCSGKTLVETEY